MSLFFSQQPQNQWTQNYALVLSLILPSDATLRVQSNVKFHLGLPGDLVLMKTVMTSKAKKVCKRDMTYLKLPSVEST